MALPVLHGIFVATAGLPSEDAAFMPSLIQDVIKLAIDRLQNLEITENAIYRADTQRLLFGFSSRSRLNSPPQRRGKALRYYNEFLNTRTFAVKMANFNRRICPDELLKPLVQVLLSWEAELKSQTETGWRRLAGEGGGIRDEWRLAFWWLFFVGARLDRGSKHLENAITLMQKTNNQSSKYERKLRVEIIQAVVAIADLRSLFIAGDYPTEPTHESVLLAKKILARLPNDLLLSEEHIACLDRLGVNRNIHLFPSQDAKRYRDSAVSRSSDLLLLERRITSFVGLCRCKSSPDPLQCDVHRFVKAAYIYRRSLEDDWLTLAYNDVGSRPRFAGDVYD